jgi:hypothetical protein
MRRRLIGLSITAAAAWVSPAFAYNNREHERLPDQAVQIANIMRRGQILTKKVSDLTGTSVVPLDTRPSSVPNSEAAQWQAFVNETKALPDRIAQVRTGLADPRFPSAKCGKQYPVLAAGQHLAQCKAGDIPFAVKRGWASNASDCFIRGNYFAGDPDHAEFFNSLPSNKSGALLGFYGQAVDDEVNDSMWWFSVENAQFVSTFKTVIDDASDFSVAIILAPFACLWALFSGDNCIDKARDWGHQANPVTRADELAKDIEKSIDPFRLDGDDVFSTVGVWHYINVEDGPNGDFNQIAGMHYTHGGWRGGFSVLGVGRIDAVDLGVIIGGDATGMTLDPDEALGVSRYQQSPDGPISRRKDDWFNTIGHIEFEPLDNLALFGWRRFQRDHDASGLGWVLHALGDAAEPHHGIAASGWGHRPFEDFAGFAWADMFAETKAEHYALMSDIVEEAFGWWSMIDAVQKSGNPNDIPVRDLVTELAFATRQVSDFAIKTAISIPYGSGPDEHAARDDYGGNQDQTRDLLVSGTAATLAFLVKASQLIATDTSLSPCACPNGQGRISGTCQACASIGQVEVDGVCSEGGCPADLPLLDPSAHCVANCPAGNCTGPACPPDQFVEGQNCVAQCSAANNHILDRQCLAACPADDVTVTHDPTGATGPFYCEKSFCNTTLNSHDSQQICCPSSKKFLSDALCVASCPPVNNFFIQDLSNRPSICRPTCTGSGNEYFVPGSGPFECLTQCPTTMPFGVAVTGGESCEAACPAATPFHNQQFFTGQTVNCEASCPTVHNAANECISVCPMSTPLHQADGLCVASCPAATPFHLADGTCVASCPFGVGSNNECNVQGPD